MIVFLFLVKPWWFNTKQLTFRCTSYLFCYWSHITVMIAIFRLVNNASNQWTSSLWKIVSAFLVNDSISWSIGWAVIISSKMLEIIRRYIALLSCQYRLAYNYVVVCRHHILKIIFCVIIRCHYNGLSIVNIQERNYHSSSIEEFFEGIVKFNNPTLFTQLFLHLDLYLFKVESFLLKITLKPWPKSGNCALIVVGVFYFKTHSFVQNFFW